MPANFLSESERLRFSQFPSSITESDLICYFTLSKEDLVQVKKQRKAYNRLGFAIQLCILRYLGFSPDNLKDIPLEVIGYLAQQLHQPIEDLTLYGERSQTRTGHLQQILNYLQFRNPTDTDLAILEKWLIERAQEHDKPFLLFQLAAQKLRTDKIVRPGVTVLERLVGTARNKAILETFQTLSPLLTQSNRQFLDSLLTNNADIAPKINQLTWLRQSSTINSPSAIVKTLNKLSFLKQQGIHQWDISHLNPNYLKFLAKIGKKSTGQYLKRTSEERRYPILVAFVCQILVQITDEAMDLFLRCLSDTYRRAKRDLELFRLQKAEAINEKVIVLNKIGKIILDDEVKDIDLRSRLFEIVSLEDFKLIIEDCGRLIRPSQDECYDFLGARYSYIRQFSPVFLKSLGFCSNSEPDPLLNAISLLCQLDSEGKRKVPNDTPLEFVPSKWKTYVLDGFGHISRRYYELSVLWALRIAVRSGNVWLEGSRRYANPETYLIPKEQWQDMRPTVFGLLQIGEDGEGRLKELGTHLDAELVKLNETIKDNHLIRIEADELIVSHLDAEKVTETKQQLEHLVSKRLPHVDLTDLLIEVDQLTGFSQFLIHAGGGSSRSNETKTYLYAAILAQACNLGLKTMAQIADLSYDSLVWHTNWYLCEETLRPAINAIVDFQCRQSLSKVWGSGILSSSDGQRFPVSVKNSQAVALPRYFGYGKGITFYTWTSDQFSQYGDKVIPSTMRDATYLLDGILDNETELNILEHTTDTAGYTDVMFALFDVLGLRFSPRIRDIGKKSLYRLNKDNSYLNLDILLKGNNINQSLILERWDDILRVAGSLKLGWVTASLFVGKLQSFPQQNNLLRAVQEYGKLIKTIFILRYLNREEYRRSIHSQLNKGEALHSLRRFLFFAHQGQIRKRQQEDLANQSSCLTLVTNAAVAWNTVYISQVLEEMRLEGYPVFDDDVAHLSPARYEHINPYGKFFFDITGNSARQGLRPLR
jgi:TnpA family transposase